MTDELSLKSHSETPRRMLTVIFDGDCRICTRIVNSFERWDRDGVLELIPSQAPGVKERFPAIPSEYFTASLQVVVADGRIFQGARAVEEVLNVLPKGRLFTWIFSIPFARPLAERFYAWFARHRHRLGCGDHCSIGPKQKR